MRLNKILNRIQPLIKIGKHVFLIVLLGLLMLLSFFYIYLPISTNHGETVTVPDLEGIDLEDLDEFLLKRDLRYEVSDSSYSGKYPPMAVLLQFPKAGAKVKENRKIYITLNRINPPTTSMPDLTIGSLRNAEAVLESTELIRGKLSWRPDLAFNRVLEQRYKGRKIEPGTLIPKGSAIDLVIGDGFGKRSFPLEDLAGMTLEDAQIHIPGTGLEIGTIINSGDSVQAAGIIVRQVPEAGSIVRIGQTVDLWVVPIDSVTNININHILEQDSSNVENL
jgi:beta-lactam-binding protein with PASTA domain